MRAIHMVILLGGSGYVGQTFQRELVRRGWAHRVLARASVDYTRFETLLAFLREQRPALVINAAGFSGRPNVDGCEEHRAETLLGNTLLPQTVAQACAAAGVPWGHVSSGCIYDGAKVLQPDGTVRVERDLTRPDVQRRLESDPASVRGFSELDEPNFSFRQPPCSFYSGSKALAEEVVAGVGQGYLWRLRIPFDERDGPRNFLSKLQRYPKVYDNVNSISHLGDFVGAALDLWAVRAPFGIYNVTNPGFVITRQVVALLRRELRVEREFVFWKDNDEFYREAVRAPRSNCVLDVSKLGAAGVKMRPVEEALLEALRRWQPEARPHP